MNENVKDTNIELKDEERTKCEIWTRVMGYHRPISSFNIGKQGAMLKKIGELARADIEAFMGTKVFLQTWVKVKENWRDSTAQLRNFGFTE